MFYERGGTKNHLYSRSRTPDSNEAMSPLNPHDVRRLACARTARCARPPTALLNGTDFGELYVLFIILFIPSIKRAQEGTTR